MSYGNPIIQAERFTLPQVLWGFPLSPTAWQYPQMLIEVFIFCFISSDGWLSIFQGIPPALDSSSDIHCRWVILRVAAVISARLVSCSREAAIQKTQTVSGDSFVVVGPGMSQAALSRWPLTTSYARDRYQRVSRVTNHFVGLDIDSSSSSLHLLYNGPNVLKPMKS